MLFQSFYLIPKQTLKEENLTETHLHSQWLYELPLSHHLHGFSWSFRRILNGVKQPKNMIRSTTNLQAETPALVTPLYPLDWKLQEDAQYYQTVSDCVHTTDKNKPYWNNIWVYGAFSWKKYSFCQSYSPPILNQPLLPGDELFFHVCNAFKHK